MTTLHIRDVREGERDDVRDLTLSAYQEYAAQVPAHWEAYRQGIISTLARARPSEQIAAFQDGTLVGSVLLCAAGSELVTPGGVSVTLPHPELRLLAVAPAARGRGIGEALVHECIQRSRRSGATALTLHTTDVMKTAMRLYERLGFARAPELDFQPAPDLNIKGYRLRLDAAAK
jgi:GNAT superfamily N-acetyltransferase